MTEKRIRFGSVCSGIEAASVAWHPLGWRAAWLSEIEPFPGAVLAHHYPNVPNLGDMTTLPERILSGEVEAPDLFCGGTPCQAFSVAGLRNSLDDARGNLSLTFCEVANAIDNVRLAGGNKPAIIFWENVPGVLSTKDNAFGCFLGALAGEDGALEPSGGKWTNAGVVLGPQRAVAWRVLDAQYFGVAQRRRRVFVVASARDDFDPAAVLFEFDGVRRDSAPSREAWEEAARSTGSGAAFGGVSPVAGTLTANTGGMTRPAGNANELDFCVPVTQFGDTAGTLTASHDNSPCADRGMNVVAQPIALQDVTPRQKTQNGKGWNDDGTAYTVDTHATQGVAQPIAWDEELNPSVDIAGTLVKGGQGGRHDGVAVAFQDSADCLTAAYGTKWNGNASATNGSLFAAQAMQVRRLTPRECETLQGFPQDYTAIPWRKKSASECPDGPRYKALGNSWAVPVVAWIGKRIENAIRTCK